jgi:hypothetical protein
MSTRARFLRVSRSAASILEALSAPAFVDLGGDQMQRFAICDLKA